MHVQGTRSLVHRVINLNLFSVAHAGNPGKVRKNIIDETQEQGTVSGINRGLIVLPLFFMRGYECESTRRLLVDHQILRLCRGLCAHGVVFVAFSFVF